MTNTSASDDRPIAAVLTPAGRGAVAVVRVRGVGATQACERFFAAADGKPTASAEVDRIRFGRWSRSSGDATGAAGEELIVCRRDADDVEVHCHGGTAAAAAVCDALADAGCRIVDAEQWLEAIEPELLVYEATTALAQVRTKRATYILLEQLAGALRQDVEQVLTALKTGNRDSAIRCLRNLRQAAIAGCRLTDPFRVVLAGRPNVGKSSLLNALVGHRRALVFDQPGTTRDVVTAPAVFDGWAVEIADTAGLRSTDDELESAGIEAALRRQRQADLILLVRDATEPSTPGEEALLARHPDALVVWNKADLADPKFTVGRGELLVSAMREEGIGSLIAAVVKRLVVCDPPAGAAVPFTNRQRALISEALTAAESNDAAAAGAALDRLLGATKPPSDTR